MDLLAVIGSQALWLTYAWLAAAIVASYLSARKGYGEKLGLAFGLLLSARQGRLALEAPGSVRQRRQDRGRAAGRAAGGPRRAGLGPSSADRAVRARTAGWSW